MNVHPLRPRYDDLTNTLRFLRTLTPESRRYKLWLGDLVELVNEAFGPDSAQMAEVRAVLAAHAPVEAEASVRTAAYLARLDAFARLLDRLGRHFRAPLITLDPNGGGSARRN